MEDKKIEKRQAQKIVIKRVYTPPTLIVYGRLTELTAGGTTLSGENGNSKTGNKKP